MEAVPRLPMLSFPAKLSSKSTEFGEYLKRYIRDHYHEDPESYNNEVSELESLRRSAVNASTDFIGCSSLKRYYCQLHFLTSRFPLEDVGTKLSFTWSSAFDQSFTETGDIKIEMNSILFNIAVLHTALGATDARTSPDGMKISCTHFQCASWAFQVLSQSPNGDADFNPLLMTFMTHLALSQAQECILEKSMTDNRKPNIIAKVAMQVVEYLRLTLKNLESLKKSNANIVSLVSSKLIKVWQRHCDFKIAYYLAVTYFHQGLQSEEQQKMGERIAFYQGAVDKLDEASKLSKNMEKAKAVGETITFANDVIRGKLTAAQKENEFVYHEKVPPLTSLPEVKGASLVKGISFSFTDKEVSGPDIFSRLVPMEAHQASSLYSEEKAKLLRRITSEIQEKNEELEMYLASMQLDSFAFEENFDFLSQELVDACADLNSRDAFKSLNDIMATINNYYHDLQAKFRETEGFIKQEESNEKEFCLVMGTKRAPNQIMTELKREVYKYKEAHEAALSSNQALHNAITQHKENILMLSRPLNTLTESLPSVAGVESEPDKATRLEVQRLLNKIQEMKTQRSDFENKLRMDLHNDDVTKQLVTNQEDMEEFFRNQIGKHSQLVSLLEQNMSAQGNILQALSEANAAYGAMRRTINQIKEQRSSIISSLLSSYNAFLNIIEKADEAKEFYSKLESQVNKVNSRVKSFGKVQEEEREERMAANMKKIGGGVKFDSYKDSNTSSGPRLKDFLQAGMGIRGDTSGVLGMKGLGNDIPGVDLNAQSGFLAGPSLPQMGPRSGSQVSQMTPGIGHQVPQMTHGAGSHVPQIKSGAGTDIPPIPSGSGYPPGIRPTPIGSERNDVATPSSYISQQPYSMSTQYPPSAPASASSQSPYPSQPSQKPYNYSSMYYPPNQISNVSTASVSTSSTATASTVNNVHYPAYNQPNYLSSTGYNNSQIPTYGTTTTPLPAGNVNNTGGSSNTYQQPQHGDPRLSLQNVPATISNYMQQPLGPHPSEIKSNTPSSLSTALKPNSSAYNQPSIPYINNLSASNTSYPSGSYVSQAGAYKTNLSPSGQGQHLPASTEVRNPYFNAPSQSTPSNYAPTVYSTLPSNVVDNSPKYDPSYSSSKPSAATSSFVNSNSNPAVSTTLSQGNKISNGSALYTQNPNTLPSYYSNSYPQTGIGSHVNTPAWSTGNANAYIPNQSHAYNPNSIPSSTAAAHTNVKHPPALPTYKQYYPQDVQPSASSNQYQAQVTHSSVPYSNVPSATSASYNYSQAYGYSAMPNAVPPTTYSGQFQSPHYSNIQATSLTPTPNYPPQQQGAQPVQPTYQPPAVQQGPQQPLQHTQSIQPPISSGIVSQPPNTNKEGISNLDLLSDIDINVSTSSLWSPLQPQTSSSSASNSELASAGNGPDLTSTVTCVPSEDISNNANTSVLATPLAAASEPLSVPASMPHVIDLSMLSKPKRSASVLDPLSDDKTLLQLASETERFSKFVQGLDKKSLNGPTNLELKWNELIDALETKCSELKVSVGRCYPLKNRFPDNLSFDETRVPLPSTRDDYINASFVQLKSVEDSIPLIITQAPMPNTFVDFWSMVWENQVEIVVCINTDAEVKNQIYFPKDSTESVEFGSFTVSLKQSRSGVNNAWIQRTLHLTHSTLKTTKVVLHLQFLTWPPSAMPESPGLLLQFIGDFHNLQKQQRNKLNPVVVHCVSGTGRSGILAVLSSFMKQLQSNGALVDIWNLVIELSQQRRIALQDRTHLLFLFSSALYYAQEVLMKRGILTDKATFEEGPREKTHVRHPSSDLLSSDLNRMRAKLGMDECPGNENNLSRSGSQTSVLSVESSTGVGPAQLLSHPSSISPSPTHSIKSTKVGVTELPPNLAASLDPNCLVLTTPNPNKPKKITKENFINNQSSGLGCLGVCGFGSLGSSDQNPDPLSGLDPLWNMKKT